jgi:hypothetical protein
MDCRERLGIGDATRQQQPFGIKALESQPAVESETAR